MPIRASSSSRSPASGRKARGTPARGRHTSSNGRCRNVRPLLTKQGADILVRVERLMDDATKALATSDKPGSRADTQQRRGRRDTGRRSAFDLRRQRAQGSAH